MPSSTAKERSRFRRTRELGQSARFEPERLSSPLGREQSAPGGREDPQRIQVLDRKREHARGCREETRLQAARHVLRRDLIDQADEIVRVQAEQVVLDADHARAARAEPVEVVHFAGVAAEELGVHGVHGGEVLGDVCEGQGGEAVVPVVEDLLAFVEDEGAAALFGAEEAADEVQDGGAGVAGEVGEEAEEEAGGPVEEDDLWAEVESGICRERLVVS